MNVFKIGLGIAICAMFTLPVLAEELKVNIGVESGAKTTEVVGANIYAKIDGKLTEILVRPDDQAFFMLGKYGALRINSFWESNAKANKAE